MTRSKGSDHPIARRVAMASMSVLAASGIGLVAAPMAFGQILIPLGGSQSTEVTNSGSASANSGGNTAIGNASTNTATSTSDSPEGGLLALPITLGAPTNTSDGTAAVTTGPANASGNSAQTNVGQSTASGSQVNSFLAGQRQAADVTNAGSASANSGGNVAVGNASQNTAAVNNVSGGLLGVGVTLGGPTNNSTGTAAINSGAANAVGNTSGTNVGQSSLQGGAGGGKGVGAGPCGSGRFASIQHVEVVNQGEAQANTGDNVAIGNASTNNASTTHTVSGGLLGVGLNIGGPVNNSSGTAAINTGPATAVGNNSVTQVGQTEGCPQVTTLTAGTRPGVAVATSKVRANLARTGLDTGDLGMIAGALVGAGMLIVASQRRRMAARSAASSAAVPMAGSGFAIGLDDWDGAVR